MTDSAQLLLACYEHLVAAHPPLAGVPGARGTAFSDAALVEARLELEHLMRRIRNLLLLHGCPPKTVERLERMNGH